MPGEARLLREGGEGPREFLDKRLAELAAQDDPFIAGAEQKAFLALVAKKVQEVLEAEAAAKAGEQKDAQVEQSVILLCGQGGSGKTEVTQLCREMFARFSAIGPM